MIVAKFGGTSVADSSCISRVINIIQNNPEQQVVVISALGGITNMIQDSAQCAANGNLKYQKILSEIEERHFSCIKKLIPIKAQSQVLSHIKQQINALSTLHEGFISCENYRQELKIICLALVNSFPTTLSPKLQLRKI